MRNGNKLKLVIDTNIWISFLIGKKLSSLKRLFASEKIILVLSKELIEEIELVTQRPKLAKYFSKKDIQELLSFMQIIGKVYSLGKIPSRCRDPKDDYLLALAVKANADYLLTGDNDLLSLNKVENIPIITVSMFETIIKDE